MYKEIIAFGPGIRTKHLGGGGCGLLNLKTWWYIKNPQGSRRLCTGTIYSPSYWQYTLMKAFPVSFVVCFLLLLGHAIGFLGWEMGVGRCGMCQYSATQNSVEKCSLYDR